MFVPMEAWAAVIDEGVDVWLPDEPDDDMDAAAVDSDDKSKLLPPGLDPGRADVACGAPTEMATVLPVLASTTTVFGGPAMVLVPRVLPHRSTY